MEGIMLIILVFYFLKIREYYSDIPQCANENKHSQPTG